MRVLTDQVSIKAPPGDVWAVLEDFGGVAKWAPNMRRSRLVGSQATDVGARRIMHHHLGFNFEEVITGWEPGKGYSFEVYRAPYPMKNVSERWISSFENGCSLVRTQVRYKMHLGSIGFWLDRLIDQVIVRREKRAGLRGLKSFIEAQTGEPGNV